MDCAGHPVCLPYLHPDGSHLCLDDPGNVKNYSENTGGRKQWNIQFQIHPEIKCFHWLTSCTSGLPGMCRAGAGPYGIGVSVVEDTPIDVFFTFDPDPVLDCKILPEEIPEYTVGVIGSWSGERKYLSREEVGSFSLPRTRRPEYWRKCSRYFEGKTWIVSCADCQEAFGILADAEMREAFGLDEQEQIGPKLEM